MLRYLKIIVDNIEKIMSNKNRYATFNCNIY